MESLLKEKNKRGQFATKGRKQYSVFDEERTSHSHAYQTVLRHSAIDLQFGQRTSHVVHSRNLVSELFLVVKLKTAASGNYAKNISLCLIKNLVARANGREFCNIDYETTMYRVLHKLKDKPLRDEFVRLTGGAAALQPGDVVVWLPVFWSRLHRQGRRGRCWSNGTSASKLEFEFDMNSAASCSAGDADNKIDSAEIWYEEVLVAPSLENSITPANVSDMHLDYHVQLDVPIASGVQQEIQLAAALSSGHIKTMCFRERATASAGVNKDLLAVSRPSYVRFKINGVETGIYDTATILDVEQLLQGFKYKEGETIPYVYSWGAHPEENYMSGHIPSSNNQFSVVYTPGVTGFLDIICEQPKVYTRAANNRLEKADT